MSTLICQHYNVNTGLSTLDHQYLTVNIRLSTLNCQHCQNCIHNTVNITLSLLYSQRYMSTLQSQCDTVNKTLSTVHSQLSGYDSNIQLSLSVTVCWRVLLWPVLPPQLSVSVWHLWLKILWKNKQTDGQTNRRISRQLAGSTDRQEGALRVQISF